MKLPITTCLLALAIAIQSVDAQGEMNLYGDIEFGPYPIGITQLTFTDTSRDDRQIQISVWYPAKEGTDRLTFSNYLDEKGVLDKSALLGELSIGIVGREDAFASDSLEKILNTPMKAVKDAEPEKSNFPLLIWSARYGTLAYQNIISEYLASHGYVVAFAEDIPNTSYPWAIQSADEKEKALVHHVTDMNKAIEYLRQQSYVDDAKVGILSWSYAGESAILSQMSNPEVDLVVGLSALGFSSGVYLGPELKDKLDITRLNVPYLILTQKFRGNGSIVTKPVLFDSMHLHSRFVSFEALAHGSFNALEGMIPGVMRTEKVQGWSKGGEVAQIGYEAICEITLLFVNAVFNETSFGIFDSQVSNLKEELPDGFFLVESPGSKE